MFLDLPSHLSRLESSMFFAVPPFNLKISVRSAYTSAIPNTLTSHIQTQSLHNAKALLEGDWYCDELANLTQGHTMLDRDSARNFILRLSNDLQSCYFHPDIIRAREMAKKGLKTNLSWWKVQIQEEVHPENVYEVRISERGEFNILKPSTTV